MRAISFSSFNSEWCAPLSMLTVFARYSVIGNAPTHVLNAVLFLSSLEIYYFKKT